MEAWSVQKFVLFSISTTRSKTIWGRWFARPQDYISTLNVNTAVEREEVDEWAVPN